MNKKNHKGIVILNTYWPPKGSQVVFINTIREILEEFQNERYSDIFLLGDLNMDHTSKTRSEYMENLEHMINMYDMRKIIVRPMRVTMNSATLIDVLYIKTSRVTTPLVINSAAVTTT